MEKTIGVIGFGVVGGATAEFFRRMGHNVLIKDQDPVAMDRAHAQGYGALEAGSLTDAIFVCVPETVVPEALRGAPVSPVTVIRSSVQPGTTERMSQELGRPLVHMPEFLKEATALWDVLNPNFIIVGANDAVVGHQVEKLVETAMVPVITVSTDVSEMVKLTMNCYLHTIISFWNEMHLICETIGVPSHLVGRLCSQDPRVTEYGANMHGKPAGGRCLPKDLAQMTSFAESQGYLPEFLKAVELVNHRVASAAESTNGKGPLSLPKTSAQVKHSKNGNTGMAMESNGAAQQKV
ncbi:MAG: NAD(P)-binding domain-containing protein [Dehalococcoidia bacterium]